MKSNYDKNTKNRQFNVGDKVLVLLSLPGNFLKATFSGPWKIVKKISSQNYVVETPNRKKKYQVCHVNMLKHYIERDEKHELIPEMIVGEVSMEKDTEVKTEFPTLNPEILDKLPEYLSHLEGRE